MSEIEKLIRYRHKGPCTTDDGEAYVRAAGAHEPDAARLRGWATVWTPLIDIDDLLASLDPQCPFPHLRADSIGKVLMVREAERRVLDLRTIRAIDVTTAQMTAARRKRKRDRDAARRADEGMRPRTESFSRTKPWIAAGFKTRRTWERHGKP